ncbi:MAG TPA: ATP-binding protein [Steroidobacteraceae bacterium]|nr:ATP-binding protein [Steroidobacteraceae bacterium]
MQYDSTTLADLQTLQARLAEAEEMLRAIRAGEIDAVVVRGPSGEQVYTLRNADSPYRTLVEQMQDGAAILSAEGDILYCNLSLAQLFGLPLQEVIGGSILRFFDMDGRDPVASLLASGYGKRRTRLISSGGKATDVLLSLTSSITDEVRRNSLIVTDLSELHDARIGRDRAEQRSQAKDEFMAMLAHELRNPLSAITAALEVLRSGGRPDDAAQRARDIIGRQTRHLSRLVDDLLEVARAITGKITLSGTPLDLADAVRRCVAQLAVRAEERRIEVEVEGGPHWIHGDAVRIEQIITNIVSNAIKYTPEGGVIRVTLATKDGEAVLCVRDNGLGIAPELLPEIFEPFVQGERTLDRAEGGLGVGLTLVRRLVELHGGSVSASSDGPGRGSTFIIRLPNTAAPNAEPPAPRIEVATQPRRVLLIEDNRDARETFRMMLELAGHEVLEAAEGQAGLELLKSALPDIAVIDVGLPGLNGYEIASRFRQEPQSNRVMLVALTGYGTPEARERSRAAGFDHHLIKPVDPAVLSDLMGRAIPGAP